MLTSLKNIILAPYIVKAMVLCDVSRLVGGNQFRHSFNTLGILINYGYTDPILLKASLLHDVLEDTNYTEQDIIDVGNIDSDGYDVLNLVIEVTRTSQETKIEYLERVQISSKNAKILKCADRISNLTDLHLDTHTNQKIYSYLNQTEKYIIPLAKEVNNLFEIELLELISKRRILC